MNLSQEFYGEIGLEDGLVLGLDLFQDVRLDGAAQLPEGPRPHSLPLFIAQGRTLFLFRPLQLDLLGGDEEHGEDHRRRAVNGHGSADFGDGETGEEELHVLPGVDGDTPFADLSYAPRVIVAVRAVEGDPVEGDGEARPGHPP
jgi:hypothetical protein